MTGVGGSVKKMRLRYAGICRSCSTPIPAKEWAMYDRDAKSVECMSCAQDRVAAATSSSFGRDVSRSFPSVADDQEPLPADTRLEETPVLSGQAGASARREHERRVARREERIRSAHPRLGGLILALSDDPQSTTAWARGARGEELLAQRLNRVASDTVRVLHDRRIPGSRANIDHIVVSAAGVFVIDAKRYKGRPHLRVEGGLIRPRTERLLVGSRDCSKLVDGVIKQVDLVRASLRQPSMANDTPARGMLCFVEADWPLIGGSFTINGVEVLWPKKLVEHISGGSALNHAEIETMHRHLAGVFRPA